MSFLNRYKEALAVIGLGALLLVASFTVPVIAQKKKSDGTKTRIVESPPVTFSQNQADANGNYLKGRTEAKCPKGYKAVGQGGKWDPDRGDNPGNGFPFPEVMVSATFTSKRAVVWRVGTDYNHAVHGPTSFVGQVVCAK